jgi:hypothetical protein
MPICIVEGVDGIAATDPAWDGSPAFVCSNPACIALHDVHELVATNLIKRSADLSARLLRKDALADRRR